METIPVPPPISPAPPPAPAAPPPAPPPAAPVMEAGGSTGPKPLGHFFDGITLLDVGMVALVSLALYYSIYASRLTVTYIKNRQQQLAAPAATPTTAAASTPATSGTGS